MMTAKVFFAKGGLKMSLDRLQERQGLKGLSFEDRMKKLNESLKRGGGRPYLRKQSQPQRPNQPKK